MSRTKSGLRRKSPLQVHFDDDEKEWVAREAFEGGISRAAFIRNLTFTKNWRKRLQELRHKQKSFPQKHIFGSGESHE
jgi:hypothetical protein